MEEQMTYEEAKEFFAEFYRGEHHISEKIEPFGCGYQIRHHADLSTFDYDDLTRFVLMCHDRAYRGRVSPRNHMYVSLSIWKRKHEAGKDDRYPTYVTHPAIEDAIAKFRKHSPFHNQPN
ncbi:hypothetical protein [Salmonirosea aquatica]|uniref:Uncharacterized protein n=1 Tax=Salmonirosea aquatica TaxID=2654236 RepID=A0A7C9BKV3_9BACT|nr:hypothetical protein [Cytophagaceae bacterium SJW1-29]